MKDTKDPAKKMSRRIAILAGASILAGLLVLLNLGNWQGDVFTSSLVNSETVYIMLALWFVIPVALLALAVSVVRVARPHIKKNKRRSRKKRGKHVNEPRFSNLSRIDVQQKQQPAVSYVQRDLQQICEEFRNFAASELGLYYDIADIRRFIAGLGMGRLMIIRGMSGTGKTSLAYAAGAFFGNPAVIVPVQPMWKERADMIGYFNEFTKRFNETTLLCKLYEAGGSEDIYITVLDEVNISRIEYYFAEFLSLLEIPDPQQRQLEVVSDSWDNDPQRLRGGKLCLPENMWFIGTANNDDSTFAISDKVYDRAAVLDLDKKCAPFAAKAASNLRISWRDLEAQFAQARSQVRMSAEGEQKLAQLDEHLRTHLGITFGNRIMRQLREYVPVMVACGGTQTGAMDDILARKILRKLEQLSPVLLRSEIPVLLTLLEELFGEDQMPLSREYLQELARRA